MFAIPNGLRVLIATKPIHMGKSFDSLSEIVREELRDNPLSGALFVFFNRRRTAAKILVWERGGFWLFYKRLEEGKFSLPVRSSLCNAIEMRSHELIMILEGLELTGAIHRARFELRKSA